MSLKRVGWKKKYNILKSFHVWNKLYNFSKNLYSCYLRIQLKYSVLKPAIGKYIWRNEYG